MDHGLYLLAYLQLQILRYLRRTELDDRDQRLRTGAEDLPPRAPDLLPPGPLERPAQDLGFRGRLELQIRGRLLPRLHSVSSHHVPRIDRAAGLFSEGGAKGSTDELPAARSLHQGFAAERLRRYGEAASAALPQVRGAAVRADDGDDRHPVRLPGGQSRRHGGGGPEHRDRGRLSGDRPVIREVRGCRPVGPGDCRLGPRRGLRPRRRLPPAAHAELAGVYSKAGKDTCKYSCFMRFRRAAAYYPRWVLQSCSSPSDSARAC